jgi:hypothetical protein
MEIFTDLSFKKPTSASDTLIFFGKTKDTGVVLKVSLIPKDLNMDNSLLIEQDIYKNIINKLLSTKSCPHLIPMIKSFVYTDFYKTLESMEFENKEQALARLKKLETVVEYHGDRKYFDFYYRGIANVLVLKMNNGFVMYDRVTSLEPIQVESLIFQVLYTLDCFHKIGLFHNDLHMGNILVETGPNVPKEYTYSINGEIYTVPSYGMSVKIYDYDYAWAGKENTKYRNKRFNREKEHGCTHRDNCNFNPLFDAWYFLSGFINYMEKKKKIQEYDNFINRLIETIDDPEFKYLFNNKNYFKFCNTDSPGEYCNDPGDGVNEIKPPGVLLKMLFGHFKVVGPTKGMVWKFNLQSIGKSNVITQQINDKCELCDISSKNLEVLENIYTQINQYLNQFKMKIDLRTLVNIFSNTNINCARAHPDLHERISYIISSFYIPDFKQLIPEQLFNETAPYMVIGCSSVYDILFFCSGVFTGKEKKMIRRSSKVEELIKTLMTSEFFVNNSALKCANLIVDKLKSPELEFPVGTFKLNDETITGYLNLNKILN